MSEPTATSVTGADGLSLAVYDWHGTGPPTLLAHPTGFHGRVWAPTARRLVAAGRRVYSFDFRGHGDSDRSGAGYHWHGFAADALAVVRHLGLAGDPDLVAVGHSKGATSLLLGEADAPGTYPAIYSYEPIVFPTDRSLPPHHDNPLSAGARRRRDTWESPEEAYAAYAAKPPLDVFTPEALHAYVDSGLRARDDGEWELKCRPADEAQVYTMGSTSGVWGRLPEVASPVLVACGARTDAIDPDLAARIAQRLPAGRLEVFDELGHFGPMEDPDALVASILDFAAAFPA
ncbi:MAG TPA: alpha/beta hydrolase [Acidimicrobiia bacterium]|nr:alpha/beta hydrolase [Acidimicrobiia bacterium]